MGLQEVKVFLSIAATDRDGLLGLLLDNAQTQLISRLDGDVIPAELQYIVDEVAIIRFNRIGSEGMATESVEGHSAKYELNDFARFENDVSRYNSKKLDSKIGVVRFL